MDKPLREKLLAVVEEHDRISRAMYTPEVAADPGNYRKYAQALSGLTDIVAVFHNLQRAESSLEEAERVLQEDIETDMRELAEQERAQLRERLDQLETEIKFLLIPKDPNDAKNTIVEIRAGTGEEAGLFVADLFRMYSRYAELRGWRIEVLSAHTTELGGYKEIAFQITGDHVFSQMKFEGGVHRVQRVPDTETQGRIHTSAVTVAVLPEAEEVEIDIPVNDLQFDVYRSSGPGGQSVNTTDSAVRVTHKPTGLVVTCQDEKSQHKNKAKALKVLRARLLAKKQDEEDALRSATRRTQVGSGDRSERIRTYNFPQNRISDHRINLTLYNLDHAMEGEIQQLLDALNAADRAAKLADPGDLSPLPVDNEDPVPAK